MKRKKVLVLVLVISLLANCTPQSPTGLSTIERVTPPSTDTLTPKPSETATRTPSPTSTPSLRPTLTWTPLPTLSAEQAREKIRELLETNSGCELPCWWGIVPGKTLWPEALHFLRPYILQLEQGNTHVYNENGKKHTYTNFQFSYSIPGEAQPARITLGVRDDIVTGMTVYPSATEYKYQLHQLLGLLGLPKQILVIAQSSSPIPELPPTILVLDYSDMGVWASYGYLPTRIGENLSICPHPFRERVTIYDNVGGRLRLFDPNMEDPQALSLEEYADMIGGFPAKKLEDVTNMTIETFYNTFIEPQPKTCLETPANLWP